MRSVVNFVLWLPSHRRRGARQLEAGGAERIAQLRHWDLPMATDVDASEQDDALHPGILTDPRRQTVPKTAIVRSISAVVVVQCTDIRTIDGRPRSSRSARAEPADVVDTLIRAAESTAATCSDDAVGCVAVTMPQRSIPWSCTVIPIASSAARSSSARCVIVVAVRLSPRPVA